MLFIIIPLLCLPSILPAAFFYLLHRNRTSKEKRFPLALYVITLLICAIVACCFGIAWGMEFACRKPADNLCGLFAIPVGPLSSFVVVSVVAWLLTFLPLQMKRIAPVVLILFLVGGGYHYRYFFSAIAARTDLVRYRLQSADVDSLQRYVPMIEAQMRELAILKDVSLDPELKGDQALAIVDPKTAADANTKLPTRSITFRIVPPSTLGDALPAIHEIEVRLALPATIRSSVTKAP